MEKRDFILVLGDKIYKNAFGYKECASQFRFNGKGKLRRAKSIMREYCKMNDCTCAELTYFNDDCTVKCWFIYDHGKMEKFV